MLLLVHRCRYRLSRNLAIHVFVALIALSELAVRTQPALAFFLVPFRFYQFLAGAALHLIEQPVSDILQEAVALLAMFSLLLSLFLFSNATSFPGISALLPTLGTAALIHSPRSMISAVVRSLALVQIGRISYSVYLVHWPLIVSFLLLSDSSKLQSDEAICIVTVSLAFGYALHHAIEVRFRRGPPGCDKKDPARGAGRTFFIFSFTGAGLCAAACGAVVFADIKAIKPDANQATNSTASIAGYNATQASIWASDLFEPGKSDWRPRLRQRPGMNVSTVEHLAIHMTYRPATPARARMLLFGDSHAEMIIPLALRIALEKGLALDTLTLPSCPGLLTSPHETKTHRKRFCYNEQAYWRERVEQTPYDIVLLASRWDDEEGNLETGTLRKHLRS